MGAILLDEQTAPGTPSTGQVVLYPKTDGLLYSKDDAGTETAMSGLPAASQAEQEAGSSTTVATTPGRQHFHPSAAKAWVKFNGSGTVAISVSNNVSSITDETTGRYTVNFSTSFSSADYAVAAIVEGNGANPNRANSSIYAATPPTASTCQIITADSNTGGAVDYAEVYAIFLGDL